MLVQVQFLNRVAIDLIKVTVCLLPNGFECLARLKLHLELGDVLVLGLNVIHQFSLLLLHLLILLFERLKSLLYDLVQRIFNFGSFSFSALQALLHLIQLMSELVAAISQVLIFIDKSLEAPVLVRQLTLELVAGAQLCSHLALSCLCLVFNLLHE